MLWVGPAVAAIALLDVDYQALVSRSDLVYQVPPANSVSGLPIGNGRMGTMVWTGSDAICLQINRVDVFAGNKHHRGPQFGPTDYCGTCAQLTVSLGGAAFVGGEESGQRLSLYSAEAQLAGGGVNARCFVSAVADVLALEITDARSEPQPLRVSLKRWREPLVRSGNHVAALDLRARDDTAVLTQRFAEGDYHCASAVAVRVVGRPVTLAHMEDACDLVLPAQRGRCVVLISSAASMGRHAAVEGRARELLEDAARQCYDGLRRPHTAWWAEFWSRSFVHLTSPDGMAEFMERVRNLHLYAMASTSRGALPPKWNGSLFTTAGDKRAWGSQFWVWTMEMAYWPLYASGAIDLTDPFLDMVVRQLPDCEQAARQRWGCEGAFYGETMPFDGPLGLPQDVAQEFREVYRGGKPASALSPRARELAQFEGSLRPFVEPGEMAGGRYAWITHVCSSGAELAVQAWWRYRYTGDREWLRTHAYPLLRGAAELYRTLATRGDDGLYHLAGTNVHEDFWGVRDSTMDLAAIRGTVPLAIRAAELLGVDTGLRAGWAHLLANLAPYPMGSDAGARELTGAVLADDVWAAGLLGDVDGQHNPEDVWLNPVFPFEDWTLETRDPAIDRIVQRLIDLAPRHASVFAGAPLNTAIRTPIAAVRAGRGEQLPDILAAYFAIFSPLPNGLSLFEGEQAHSVEHLGLLTMVLQEALLQSVSPRPGEPEVISLCPAWPRGWDAQFSLHVRGGFSVTAATRDGRPEWVEIESLLGELCRVRNPWGDACILTVGGLDQAVRGEVVSFGTDRGGRYLLRPVGAPLPRPATVAPPAQGEPVRFSHVLANGRRVEGALGIGR